MRRDHHELFPRGVAGSESSSSSLIWVTGAKGFLGRYVSRHFRQVGWRVVGIGRGEWANASTWGADRWLNIDISRAALIQLLSQSGPPDAVFHAAGTGSVPKADEDVEQAFADSVVSTQVLLDVVGNEAPEAVFLFPSSCAVYGDVGGIEIEEEQTPIPVSTYGLHKLKAEASCRAASAEYGLRCGIIRYFSLYGRGLRKQLMWDICERGYRGEDPITLGGTGAETRDLLHVEDATRLARFLEACCRDLPPGAMIVLNGGSGKPMTVSQIADTVAGLIPGRPSIAFSSTTRPGNPPHYKASTKKAASLGFAPAVSPDDGIPAYVEWALREISRDEGFGNAK